MKSSSVESPSCVCCEHADRGTSRVVSCPFPVLVEPVGVQFASLSVHQHYLHWILPIGCVKARLEARTREREERGERRERRERQERANGANGANGTNGANRKNGATRERERERARDRREGRKRGGRREGAREGGRGRELALKCRLRSVQT